MNLSFNTNWYLIIFCITGVALSAWFSYRQVQAVSRWKRRTAVLELLRFFIILLVAFTLLRPELVTVIHIKTPPQVVILRDVSGSMNTRDLVSYSKKGKTSALKRNEWVKKQLDRKFYSPLKKKFDVSVEPFAMSPDSSAADEKNGTNLSYALSDKLSSFTNIRAVILLSDGDWNYGGSPVGAAAELRKRSIPVYALATGCPTYLPDLVIVKVRPPSFCLAGEKISIPFSIKSRMNRDIRTAITLSSEYGLENSMDITIPAHESYQNSIIWHPTKTGTYQLSLEIPVEDDELISDNNRFSFKIAVKRELIKVLVIESLPRWEYRYLRNALMRDPGIDVRTLLLHPGMNPGGGKHYISKFPSKEEMSRFDVIFLGDVGLGKDELTEENLKMIEGVVKNQGTGLVFLPGYRGRELSLIKSAVDDMFPVDLDTDKPEGLISPIPAKLDLSSEGRKHFLLQLADSPEANVYVWRKLPGFCWNAAVKGARPGSHVLAVHSGLHAGVSRMPLIVTREYGHGNVLFMGIDSAWKWRKGVEDKYHYRYWGQVVRWMAHKRHQADNEGIRCFFVPETPRRGNTLFMYAAVYDRLGRPVDNTTLTADISFDKGRKNMSFNLIQEKTGWGVYKGSFVPELNGVYNVALRCKQIGSTLHLKINVNGKKLEQIGSPVKMNVLKEIANITGGGVFLHDEIDSMVQRISALPKQIEQEKRFLIWCQWWWGAMIVFLLAAYWSIRKLFGFL